MVTEQMKTDAQRFGNGKKGYNIKQVAEMLENAGGGYTAGDGITISEDKVISVIPKGWVPAPDYNWSKYYDSTNGLKEDVLIAINEYGSHKVIPLVKSQNGYISLSPPGQDEYIKQRISVALSNIFKDGQVSTNLDSLMPIPYRKIEVTNGVINDEITGNLVYPYLNRHLGFPTRITFYDENNNNSFHIGLFVRG